VTGEARDLRGVCARADQVRDRRVPEIVKRELLEAFGVQPCGVGCLVESACRDVAVVHRRPVSVVKTKSSSFENEDASECATWELATLTQKQQEAQERPVVIAKALQFSGSAGGGTVNVDLVNVVWVRL
jgi:hypothetical protein